MVLMPGAHPVRRAPGEDHLAGHLEPEVAEPVGRPARILGEQGAVYRSDRRPHDEVRRQSDLGQRLEHPDLHGAEAGAAAKDERDWPGQLRESWLRRLWIWVCVHGRYG